MPGVKNTRIVVRNKFEEKAAQVVSGATAGIREIVFTTNPPTCRAVAWRRPGHHSTNPLRSLRGSLKQGDDHFIDRRGYAVLASQTDNDTIAYINFHWPSGDAVGMQGID